MKRILIFIIALVCMLAFLGCHSEVMSKRNIFNFVEKNYDEIVEACENEDTQALYDLGNIDDVDIVDGYVLVYCEGHGIAPSSQDYGFYYSEDNIPVAVFDGQIICDTTDLVEEGNGYQYLDSGYNVFYTEHIKGNIYFYSASF